MASVGFTVASVDWRGHGESSVRAGRRKDWGYGRLVDEVQYYINYLRRKYHFEKVYLLGHSMGGQVAHLTAVRYPKLIDGVIAIASSDPYYKMWKGQGAIAIYLAACLAYPMALLVGHFPGYVFRFAKRESRTAIRDWARAVRTGEFKPKNDKFNYQVAKSKYTGHILSISIAQDFFAPKLAVDFTLGKFPNAAINSHIHLESMEGEEVVLDHFNWVRYSERVIEVISRLDK
jgi:predicted alpha/beta hydrolase